MDKGHTTQRVFALAANSCLILRAMASVLTGWAGVLILVPPFPPRFTEIYWSWIRKVFGVFSCDLHGP